MPAESTTLAKFYFDFVVRERLIPDDVGRDLESAQSALDEARAIADDLAVIPPDADEDWRGILLTVRTASHEEVACFVIGQAASGAASDGQA